MKKYIIGFLLILVGFTIGFSLTSLLFKKASKTFIEIARIRYLHDQEILAIKAKNEGDLNKVLVHYSNLVYLTSSGGINLFNAMHE